MEYKAAFISVVKDGLLTNCLQTKSDLLLAMQNTGRNPSQKSLLKYWSSAGESITFEQFCQICEGEPMTSENDLMKAFKKIDINGDGFISHAELKKMLTTKGEAMTDEEVSRLITELDDNGDGKLDYKEFCKLLLNTSKQCLDAAQRKMERKLRQQAKPSVETLSKSEKEPEGGSSADIKLSRSKPVSKNHNTPSDGKESPLPKSVTGSQLSLKSQDEPIGSQISLRSESSRNKTDARKDKAGSHISLRSGNDSPKPAPRKSSKQEISKPAITTMANTLQEPKNLNDWCSLKRRGLFYVEDNGVIVSTAFALVITAQTSVWLTVEPSPTQSTASSEYPLDAKLFLVSGASTSNGNGLVTFTERRDSSGKSGVRADLDPGTYHILPYTSGCRLPVKKKSSEAQKLLVKKNPSSNNYILTKDFKYVLTDIFNMVDTDMNGLLSREEFNTYSIRTGEDPVGDDEWSIVQENTELKQGQLTCKGFIKLIELEADDAQGDTDDLWLALEAMGYDNSLIQTHAYPFTIEVALESDKKATLKATDGYVDARSQSLGKALRELHVYKGELLSDSNRCKKAVASGHINDVLIYLQETDTNVSVLIDNKLPNKVEVKLDCSASMNVKSNMPTLCETFAVMPTSSLVAFNTVPADESKTWTFSCMEKDLQLR